ncbi:hypothetical protein CLSA_c44770 [Clostridium saccharobutylicum DSM 13864]|uniref:Uncharacterized protein n=1 Tax=Clostridium saccharobutylicum DSM 13864 TaxID=1345695 RepID=U5MY07_CLOSA|nr:hypothetical protein CLSA_c44770 [Clostridium saccharobutylicum DSM 13864]
MIRGKIKKLSVQIEIINDIYSMGLANSGFSNKHGNKLKIGEVEKV